LAARLSSERIDRIVSSDLARAADTAREIAGRHPGALVEFTEELRERHLGQWQ
jgi:broad specificity phosphatase PhoE